LPPALILPSLRLFRYAPAFAEGSCLLRQPDLPTVPNDLGHSSGLGTGNSLRWCNLKGLAARYARPTCCPKDLGDARSFLSLRSDDVLKPAKPSVDRSHCNRLAFSIVD
jgi:hypothetical protein